MELINAIACFESKKGEHFPRLCNHSVQRATGYSDNPIVPENENSHPFHVGHSS